MIEDWILLILGITMILLGSGVMLLEGDAKTLASVIIFLAGIYVINFTLKEIRK